ncbi:hypothetical protein LF41_590 [Lysobacter dokdonensis DS-58]|uniref:STAS/SEC14 domain-containing protein n=1 Tax=Lysobacter dokdonensis DS-58 TaxID=1300345 RepID=A0A0A2X005_9GAMM|nr:hypothetical protein [Lysobacter dokdonensis]KGQ18564.1 hypothetical protein LF41_590 [Lysobacter dokdonensis DS-58]
MAQQDFSIALTRPGGGLMATVTGLRTLDNTVAYWERIVGAVAEQRPKWLYVCDRLVGDELAISEWRNLVDKMKGRGLEGMRIAHVKPSGMDHLEYCEIFAREAGIDARAFSDAGVADRWLRYGVDEESA